MSAKIKCKNCRRVIQKPNRRIKNQNYCRRKACQRARKRKWQRRKMAKDDDYRQNQNGSRNQWLEKNPDYYQNYRETHPDYTDRNRELQKKRDANRRQSNLAKMDPLTQINNKNTDSYFIFSAKEDLAKMDALIPKYRIIPVGYDSVSAFCKKGLNRQDDSNFISCQKKEVHDDDLSDSSGSSP